MKPVGLDDPRTGRWPYAVVQLRQDNALGTLWNMVGFQTKLKYAEQVRLFRTIPGSRMPSLRASGGYTATPSSIRLSCSTLRFG
jgi:methylenetetrahydrofolate--tRNA-(uracil-5-)-methyltransferase